MITLGSMLDRPGRLALRWDDEVVLTIDDPVQAKLMRGAHLAAGYDSMDETAGTVRGKTSLEFGDGSVISVEDHWGTTPEGTIRLERAATVVRAGSDGGFQLQLCCLTSQGVTGDADRWQLFVPGAVYGRNDSDHDGREDYFGRYVLDYRDDRIASLAVMAYLPRSSTYVALARAGVPGFDPAIPPGQLAQPEVLVDTDIGSLGLVLAPEGSDQVMLRASYPFAEEISYCLDWKGTGWAGFTPLVEGKRIVVSYDVLAGRARSMTQAIWDLVTRRIKALRPNPGKPPFSMDESLEYRMSLVQQYYREWDKAEDDKEPAGYGVHFSPRTGRTLGRLLEFGYSGAQPLLAHMSIRYGYLKQERLPVLRARRVLDFFVRHCQLENGFAHSVYDVTKHDFVYWFTGILLPFQYSADPQELRRNLGSQIFEALAPVAEELKSLTGNYMRSMCESFHALLGAYEMERHHGEAHSDWLTSAKLFGEFLLATQGEDGSWHRAYNPSGEPLTSPPSWFGASASERKSGTLFPAEVLVKLYKLTDEDRYLISAEKAASFIIDTYVEPVEYIGGLVDTTHVKAVKTDAVGIMFVVRSLLCVYQASGERRYLDGALAAARVLASWVYLWNVPFPEGTLAAGGGFQSTGWCGCDVLPAGSYLDNEFPEFVGDIVKLAEISGDEELFDVAELVHVGMQFGLSSPANMLGYVAPGIQCEGLMASYWLSAPEGTSFSGAVAKVKGDDNDTCNGLINGQSAYGFFDLLDTYGTLDMAEIRTRLFGAPSRTTD